MVNKIISISTVIFVTSVLWLSGCINQEPADVHLHSDECSYCKMVISDTQFAAQLVSEKGKSYKFDSIECMAAYTNQNPGIAENARLYLSDFTQEDTWLPLEDASVYHSKDVRSPMGLSLFAIPVGSALPDTVPGARKQEWNQILELVLNQWNAQR